MLILILILALIFLPKTILAADEFNISQQIKYQIDTSGNAIINQQIELTNNYSQIYPKEYQITLTSDQIENITGSDDLGNIIQKIDQQNGSTIINIAFNQANTGKNQVTKFKLNYSIKSLAQSKGNTWEIALPENQSAGYQNQTEIFINVPTEFGNLSFTSATPQNNISLDNQTQLYFKNSSKSPKILLIFGDYQLFDFKLKYFLTNSSKETKNLSIAIPPDTDSQKINYRSIDPTPQNIVIDPDGNYLASYTLSSNQEIEINLDGQAKIIHTNINRATIDSPQYLQPQIYWETNNSTLISIANTLKTPKDIYNYVTQTLNYKTNNYDTSLRQGASLAINSPNNALCTEFTDLFIALCRIKGIPAREVQGYAYSNNTKIKPINLNTDVLHAWPQYYDTSKQAWISVDPTWGKTTNGIDYFNDLDPNHFAFVFHGLDSQQPLPPGGYKNNQNVKTVTIEFAKTELTNNQLPLTIKTVSSLFQSPKIKIINPNYYSISQVNLNISATNYHQTINLIPPLVSMEINLPSTNFIKNLNPKSYQIKISYNNDALNLSLSYSKLYLSWVMVAAAIITLIGFSGIIVKRNQH